MYSKTIHLLTVIFILFLFVRCDDSITSTSSTPVQDTTKSTNDQNNLSDPAPSGSVEEDREALMDLYEATNGTNWSKDSGWGNGDPSNSWHGVEVNNNGRVVSLDLSGNRLSGFLPKSIGNLTALEYFNVKQNAIVSEIPATIGDMVSLTHLLLNGRKDDMTRDGNYHPGKPDGKTGSSERSNQFTGQIPQSIGNLENLEYLEITGQGKGKVTDGTGYSNALTGPIPEELGNLTNLIGLHLDYNCLTSIPESLGNLTQLTHIGLTGNALEGEKFPKAIGNMTELQNIWMGYNNLSGTIPDISRLTKLRIFIIPQNKLTGEIPGYLFDGTMPEINLVNLAFNEFSGSLPEFGKPNNLKALQVTKNNLTGRIPSSIKNVPKMTNFSIAWNNFEGQIPDLSHMKWLRYFRANDNNFTGTLPMFDTSNKKLQFIRVHNNRMSNRIPAKIAKAANQPKFRDLDIRNNNFSQSDMQPLVNELRSDGNLEVLSK